MKLKTNLAVIFPYLLHAYATKIITKFHTIRRLDQSSSDLTALNCALHVKHLEYEAYRGAMNKFSVQDFVEDGLDPWVFSRFQEILEHEKFHVGFLEDTLSDAGVDPAKPCAYKFSYSTPRAFAELASKLETFGSSSYQGAAVILNDKQFVAANDAIAAIEDRHSGWIDSSVRKVSTWSGPFGVPLNCRQVHTLISPFVDSCPPTNPVLPEAYPPLAISISASAKPNHAISLTFPVPQNSTSLFVAFLSAFGMDFAPVYIEGEKKMTKIPENVRGNVFVLITEAENVTDESVVAGPALLELDYDSKGRLE